MEVILSDGSLEIGFIENTISNHCLVLWFYRKEDGRWIRISEERCHPSHRSSYIRRLLRKDVKIVALGRGT